MNRIHQDVSCDLWRRTWTPGPKAKGYVKVLVNIPPEYLELMRIKNEECGGLLSVNEQIRSAIRGALCGLEYISLLKT